MAAFLSTFLTEADSITITEDMANAGLVGFVVGASAILLVVGLVWYLLSVIAYWKIFTKAGEAGWKSLIPFYNSYTQFKITWDSKYYLILIAISIVSVLISTFSGQSVNGAVTGAASVISFAASVVCIVIAVMADYKLSVSYGHGVGFAVGLVLLSPIFMLILGLGSSQYVGRNGIPGESWQ